MIVKELVLMANVETMSFFVYEFLLVTGGGVDDDIQWPESEIYIYSQVPRI
jgi:hypothetical protein